MARKSVSIFYLSVGSGHQVAAESIADMFSYYDRTINVRVVDPFIRISENLPSILEHLQALSILLTPGIYDMLWRRRNTDLFERIAEVDFLRNILEDELNTYPVDTIIATHVLPCLLAANLKKDGKFKRLYGVVTDFGLNPLWPLYGVDCYFVGHMELKNTLIYRGADSQIKPYGIPISKNFQDQTEHLKDTKNIKIMLVIGGIRKGAYVDIEKESIELIDMLSNTFAEQIELTVITGNQKELQSKLEQKKGDFRSNVQIYGFVEDIHSLMSNHNILISKPGGLITSEALASRMCIISMKPGPGQETANSDFLARHGVALRGESVEEIVNAVKICVEKPLTLESMQKRAVSIGRPFASRDVVREIIKHI